LKQHIERLDWELIEATLNEQRKTSALKKIQEFKQSNTKPFFLWKLNFADVFEKKGGFDVVIANPPYVSYGLRGGQSMAGQEKEFLKRKYPNSAEYKISLYAVFMDKAIEIAKQDGGVQSFIVPDSFLLGRYFSKIRNFILRFNEIISILLLPYSVFQATVGFSVVYLFQRKPVVDQNYKIITRYAENNEVVRINDFKEYSYPQNYFGALRYNRFRLFFSKDAMNMIFKIEKDSVELGSVVKFSSGLIGKDGQASIMSPKKKNNKWMPGIISGGEFNKYCLKPAGNFLLYDKAKIKSGYEGVDYFNEKIIIRQTGDSLICAFDNTKLLTLNNVHIGNLTNHKFSLKYIVAILNSSLFDYYYKSISLEAGRVMAQVDIETLESMAIKEIIPDAQKPLIELVDKILIIAKAINYLEDPEKRAKVEEYQRQINKLVHKLYGLTPEEIKIVEGK